MLTEDVLTAAQIDEHIIGNVCKHQSSSHINRYYLIRYNADRTFIMKTFDDGMFLGNSFGTYEIVERDGIGYLDVKYDKLYESPYSQSRFNSKHSESVYKTMENFIGPFAVERSNKRSCKLVFYKTSFSSDKIKVLFMFNEQEFRGHC
jgi:hypothetical protein